MIHSETPRFATDEGIPTRRPSINGSRHAISAGHHLAAAAGYSLLEAGGNAVDAGCCAGIALAVLHADEVNFAGVAPIMIRTPQGRIVTIDGLGTWPKAFPADLFLREDRSTSPGILETVVPAAPSAWITALQDFGTMSFGEVAAPAIRLAREGFPVFPYLAEQLRLHREDYAAHASSAAIFLPGGRPPEVGERFIQSDLAATIGQMVDAERVAAGQGRKAALRAAHDAFYRGEIGRAIADFHHSNGSYLSYDDLESYHCKYEEPVRVRWRDFEVLTCGPWCQGPVLGHCLRMLERAEDQLDGLDHNGLQYVHLVTEVMKSAFADREYRYGDPRFVDVGLDKILSDAHVDAQLSAISADRAMPEMPPPMDGDWTRPAADQGPVPHAHDTSYVCVIDQWGGAFSATPSDCSWITPVVPGTGLVPSSRGVQSRSDPSHPSGIAPGKRPRLTPNPAIAIRGDGSMFVWGCPGGDMQVQAMLQVFLNVFHFGMDVQDAISAPRFSTWSFPNSFAPFEYLPGVLALEDRFSGSVVNDLAGLGHTIERWPAFTRAAAAVEAVFLDRTSGFLRAGADPRQPAYAIAS